MSALARDLCPPLLWRALASTRGRLAQRHLPDQQNRQDLELYWDEEMAAVLERWGEGTTWTEIQLLMAQRCGRALDIACGTGKVMALLREQTVLDLHGCDISDMLIAKAIARGINATQLLICDATKLPYQNEEFDYSYSIGSFEHFTADGIERVLAEAARVTKTASFHMVPTARSGRDEGWLKTYQSFHNCSEGWWFQRFKRHFPVVTVVNSRWEDRISVGKWFLCSKSTQAPNG
ncbi:MAG TPA: class I SAM-dependent methyltransferase [Candidatus Acidoferrales bacterium]|nr:class I SAM-dependent methyltransferase [Candidatus Acidoferrales bacterium]